MICICKILLLSLQSPNNGVATVGQRKSSVPLVTFFTEPYKKLNKMEEIWKDVVGYEGIYCVSNMGNVKSIERLVVDSIGRRTMYKGVLLVTGLKRGYKSVNLYKHRKMKTVHVHRLAATAFIKNPLNLPTVNHKDLVKTNNEVSNLEWCTYAENIAHYRRIVMPITKRGYDDCRSKPIVQLTLDMEFIADFGSIHEMNRITGMHRQAISEYVKGNKTRAYGYTWMYKSDYEIYKNK